MSKLCFKRLLKNVACMLVAVVTTVSLLTTDAHAAGINYSHSITCECCGESVWVRNRLEVLSDEAIYTSVTINSGLLNESRHIVYIWGTVEGVYGKEVRFKREGKNENITAGTYRNYWNDYTYSGCAFKAEFGSLKGNRDPKKGAIAKIYWQKSLWQYIY